MVDKVITMKFFLQQELRSAFDAHETALELSISISPAKGIIDKAYDMPSISRNVDFINV